MIMAQSHLKSKRIKNTVKSFMDISKFKKNKNIVKNIMDISKIKKNKKNC